ncbi:MAG TPA: CDP-alcohol phosphatidyltransferase family protein [Candidatus Binatia bacterium]|nr:CDP-alcohol phosphatidyltransferase family protein [Candidatus Binatia bacterium]
MTFRPAERAQQSLLSRVEKRTLLWLAARLPRWVSSDGLTLLGFVSMLGAGLCYWLARYQRLGLLLVILFLAINWFGDSLDGTLARFRNQPRPRYGFYVDHVVDTFGALFLLAGLALSGYMGPAVAASLLIAYYILSIEVYLATYTIGTFHMSFGGFGPSELRILLAIGNLALFFHPGVPQVRILQAEYRLFDVGGTIGAAGMLLMAIAAAARHSAELYRSEPLPSGGHAHAASRVRNRQPGMQTPDGLDSINAE